MSRPSLLINGVPVPAGPRWRPPPAEPPTLKAKPRVFDHLGWHPPLAADLVDELTAQDRAFSKVARQMRSSAWWHDVPPSSEPRCEVCGQRQFETPGGATCINRHGGAPSIARWPE